MSSAPAPYDTSSPSHSARTSPHGNAVPKVNSQTLLATRFPMSNDYLQKNRNTKKCADTANPTWGDIFRSAVSAHFFCRRHTEMPWQRC